MTTRSIGFLVAFAFCVVCTNRAQAQAIITVDTIGDAGTVTGNCELREAVLAAESNLAVDNCVAGSVAGPDKIVFAPGLAGQTIALSNILNFSGGAVIIDGQTRAITLQTSLGN